MGKQADAMAILKLYELGRDEQMRAARQCSEFVPKSVMDIINLRALSDRCPISSRKWPAANGYSQCGFETELKG